MVGLSTAAATRGVGPLALLTVAPLLVTFVGSLVVVVGWAAGATPFWPVTDVTLSEAAALKDAGEVVRLIVFEKHDPNRRWPVRDGLIGSAREMTPLEAAIAIRRIEMVRVLLDHGAALPRGEGRSALICHAVQAGAPDIAEFLVQSGDGEDPRARCVALSNGSE